MNRRSMKAHFTRYAAERALERLANRNGHRDFVRGQKGITRLSRREWSEFCEAVQHLRVVAAREARVNADMHGARAAARWAPGRKRCRLCGGRARLTNDHPCPRCVPAGSQLGA